MALPPGSRLPMPIQTAAFVRDPIRFFERQRDTYGDVFRVRFFGSSRWVGICDPQVAKHCFTSEALVAGKARAPWLEPVLGENSLLCLDGERWTRHRRLLATPFRGHNVERWQAQIAAIAADEVGRFPLGDSFPIRPHMQAITLEVILRVMFGIENFERRDRLTELVPKLNAIAPWMAWLPLPVQRVGGRFKMAPRVNPFAQFMNVQSEIDELLYAEIGERRTRADLDERDDVLSLLLATDMTDQELRDELLTMLEAGHETTSNALAWTFERLVHNPHTLAKLEADESGDYLEAVIKESLRVRTGIMDAPRMSIAPIELGDYEVPAGWLVTPVMLLLHRREDLYPEPAEFRPERFLGDRQSLIAWMPFGGGERRCIGAHLAMLEIRTILKTVLGQVTVRAAEPEAEHPKMHHITLIPAKGAVVIAQPRQQRPHRTTSQAEAA